MTESLLVLREALDTAGYRLGEVEEQSFLAESPERVVWVSVFETPQQLLDHWQATQAEAIGRTEALSPEKSWELYLLLGTEVETNIEHEIALEVIRRDTSYARKVLVPGLETLGGTDLDSYLAPLRELQVSPGRGHIDALERLTELVSEEGDKDIAAVLRAFKANRPLFGEL